MNQIVIDITSPTPTSFNSFIVLMKTGLENLVIDTLSFMKVHYKEHSDVQSNLS